ncbi:MAG: ferredoxin--NADP reductase [Deltaproteobacteria bacterium]|nr:ferredoxin--NADP reductase [Deltaproteobacteria bacterium]MBT6432242.1 ferredoxin--NADP reductase [Deltaproteobacteria bacterium]
MKYAPPTDPALLRQPTSTPKMLDGEGRIRGSLRQLYRDVDSVLWAFRGTSPAPFSLRDGSAYDNQLRAVGAELSNQREMDVVAIDKIAEDAVKITLRPTDKQPIQFYAGQFLTLAIEIDGELVKRPYSICSSPDQEDTVSIGVRALNNGKMSTYLNNVLEAGDTVGVYGPSGSYGVQNISELGQHTVCIAGGSGITPQMAILKYTLEQSSESLATLIFINRTVESTMFHNEIKELKKSFGDRFTLHSIYTRSTKKHTRIKAKRLSTLLKPTTSPALASQYFLCGPEELMNLTHQTLEQLGVKPDYIHREEFTAAISQVDQNMSERVESLTVHTDTGHQLTTVNPGQTLLEAGLQAGITLPFSCTMGGCGACKVKVVKGDVAMPEPNCLTQEDKASGHILSCISHACGPVILEVKS